MTEALLMPTLGLTMTEGTVDQWYKEVGDTITKGEAVVSISSEKLTHDVEAPLDGVLLAITVDNGGDAVCQGVIGYIGQEGEEIPTEESAVVEEVKETTETKEKLEKITEKIISTETNGRVFATPLARRIALEKGYNISDIIGTGGNGRVTRRDVERHIPQVVSTKEASFIGEGLEGMRKVIAQRMHRSLEQTAQLTLHRKANINDLMIFRRELKEKTGDTMSRSTLSINTLLIKAVSLALKDYPEMNASYDTKEYLVHDAVHMGVAVSVDDGLVVPVINNVDTKTLTQIGADFIEVTSQAIDGTLPSNLYSGSTFTITNLGSAGVEYFTPILNTPEIGILGVGQTSSKLIINDLKEIEEISELPLSLTFDHQVVDGAPAGEFLARIVYYLENPYLLVV